MSRISAHPRPRTGRASLKRPAVDARRTLCIAVRWRFPRGPNAAQHTLEWRIDADRATALLLTGIGMQILEVDAPVTVTRTHALTHIDAPGLLSVTLRSADHTLLFARTSLLARLGVSGGRAGIPALA